MARKRTRTVPPQGTKELIKRIESRLVAMGTNAKATSIKAGLGETAVYDILIGKNKRPAILVIKAIARALNCSAAYLIGEVDQPEGVLQERASTPILIIGIAETGAFRRMADFDQDDPAKLPSVDFARNRRYPNARHFALRIRGNSMNAAKPYPLVEGLIVVCVDFKDAGIEIETNRIYAVRRTLDGGQTYECTVKRAHVFRNRYELHPESTDPQHKPLIIPRGSGNDGDDSKEIDVIGLVYGISFEDEF